MNHGKNICDICDTEVDEDYEMVLDGAGICGDCYMDLCEKSRDAASRFEIEPMDRLTIPEFKRRRTL